METNGNNSQQRKTLGFTPKRKTSIIKVLGVGGGGSNAVNHMFKQGIEGVDFIVCNTDMQALATSPVPIKVQLGSSGLGAGGDPEKASIAAEESFENIKEILDEDTEMLFITAGMGGGTGTGAAPVIARFASEMGLLTVGIVTLPFRFEGRRKWQRAEKGIEEMKKHIDTLLIISNDKLRDFYSDLSLGNAFEKVDNVLTTAAKGIADIITVPGYVNVDFEDVKTVMKQSGKAIMGSAQATGEDRAIKAVEEAMTSPLLNDNDITGARKILLYISTGKNDIKVDEIMDITDYILKQCGDDAEIIWGRGMTDDDDDQMGVTIIATGFENEIQSHLKDNHNLNNEKINNKGNIESKKNVNIQKTVETSILDNNLNLFNTNANNETDKATENRAKTIHFLDEDIKENNQTKIKFETTKENTIHKIDDNNNLASNDEIHLIKKNKTELKPDINDKTAPSTEEVPNIKKSKNEDPIEEKSKERAEKLKTLSIMNSVKKNYRELENEPAYIRQKIQLSQPTYSSDDDISKLSLGKDGKNDIIIKPGASFLHDTVD